MKLALLAPFGDFSSSYSLSHVVVGQAEGLTRAGHDVEIWCMDTVDPQCRVTDRVSSLVRPCLRVQPSVSDRTSPERTGTHAHDIFHALCRFKPDVIITHDVMFQSGYIDFARAVHDIADYEESRAVSWYHYIHSVFGSDDHTPSNWYRYRIPAGHSLIYPNTSHVAALARRYMVPQTSVYSCPNPRDPRAFWNVLDCTASIVERYSVLTRDVVQVYPFCITRSADKGVDELVRLFDEMSLHADVLLLLADANSNTEAAAQTRARLRTLAPRLGKSLVFLSEHGPETRNSTPNSVVSELFRFSNLFVFPTKGEACPLTLAEAAMSGVHVVLNDSVPALREYAHPGASFVSLGSGHEGVRFERRTDIAAISAVGTRVVRRTTHKAPVESLLREVATRVLHDVLSNPVLMARNHAFRTFSNDAVAARLLEIVTGRVGRASYHTPARTGVPA